MPGSNFRYDLQAKRLLKIPRPANAFMLYANENRKKMAEQFPQESNKDISKRLGKSWKCLEEAEKIKYFAKAKVIGVEHKKRYPNYVYNPKEARMRKAMREASRDHSLGGIHLQSRGGRPMQSWQTPPEEQLMMNPPSELHPTICGYSSLNGAYMHQMRPYSKTLQTGPSSSWVSNSSFYSQGHSMEPLQHQQSEIWHDYQETNSCATSYIADSQTHSFPSGSQDMIPSISRGNCQPEKDTYSNNYQLQANRHVSENIALNVTETKMSTPSSVDKKGSNLPMPMHSPVCCENDENSQQYAQIFNGSQNASAVPEQNGFGGQKESRTEEEFSVQYLTLNFDLPSVGIDAIDIRNLTDIICFDLLNSKDVYFTSNNKDPFDKVTTSYKQISVELIDEKDIFYDCPENFENVGSEIILDPLNEK